MEVSTPDAGAAAAEDMDAVVERLAAARAPDIIVRRYRVHANPELSNRELHTAAFITDTLQRVGGAGSAPVSWGTGWWVCCAAAYRVSGCSRDARR